MELIETVKKNIFWYADFMELCGHKRSDMSEAAGLPARWLKDSLHKLRHARSGPTISTLEKFGKVLGVHPYHFVIKRSSYELPTPRSSSK